MPSPSPLANPRLFNLERAVNSEAPYINRLAQSIGETSKGARNICLLASGAAMLFVPKAPFTAASLAIPLLWAARETHVLHKCCEIVRTATLPDNKRLPPSLAQQIQAATKWTLLLSRIFRTPTNS